jgi:SsrA-binding protein
LISPPIIHHIVSGERPIKAQPGLEKNRCPIWYNDSAMQIKTVATNKKAYHDYFIQETVEAGLVLTGTEIKSIRAGSVNLRDSYVRPDKGELWLVGAHIARYDPGSYMSHEPTRRRKLLLHKKQIRSLISKTAEKGLTMVATKIYIKDSRAKVEVALAKGKKLYDKKDDIARRDSDREMEREVGRQKF